MNFARWVRLYATMFAIAFVVIAVAQALKGHTLAYAATQGLVWGALSALVYVLAAIYRWRKALRCEACADVVAAYEAKSRADG
ncbi:MAG: hypothetical protein ACTHKZ_00390 [Lysobacteraceae bacterium]